LLPSLASARYKVKYRSGKELPSSGRAGRASHFSARRKTFSMVSGASIDLIVRALGPVFLISKLDQFR
jgi:hypothetical protein